MSNSTHSTNNTVTTTISVISTNSNHKSDAKTVANRITHHNNNSNSNGTTPACAACKYQRRKCAPDCILAPYFPHDRQRQFLNAHKLFGVRKITKIIENLSTPAEKDEAMRAIIIQSDVRASDPVGGCYRIVRELQRQIEYGEAELDMVLHQLAICRHQQQQQQQQEHNLLAGNEHQQQQQHEQDQSNIDSAMMAVGCLDVYSDPMLLQFHCVGQNQQQQQQQEPQPHEQSDHQHDQEQEQQQHHHHHHHYHQSHDQQLHQHHHHHGYVVQEGLQDAGSVNSWGMAVGG